MFRNVPANPISSMHMFECRVGMFALWMVEAARINTLYNDNPPATGHGYFMGWPSQNPFVQVLDDSGEGKAPAWYINDTDVQKKVNAAYSSWWKDAKGDKKAAKINPLEGTPYTWH